MGLNLFLNFLFLYIILKIYIEINILLILYHQNFCKIKIFNITPQTQDLEFGSLTFFCIHCDLITSSLLVLNY